MKLVEETHPLLNKQLEPFVFDGSVDPLELANQLGELMLKYKGIGLSANQVGLPHRVFVVRSHPNITAFFNPRVVDTSEQQVLMEEGCLSYPGLHVKVSRPAHIRLRYQTHTGDTVTEKFTGLTARVILHEMDHMEGKNFLDRAGTVARDLAMRKWKKMQKQINLKRKMGYGS